MSATLELGKKRANARPRFKNRTWGTLRVSSTVSEEKPTYPATHEEKPTYLSYPPFFRG
jgi:hypothetical protein